MPVIPVIDVLAGRVVRAERGQRSTYRAIVSPLADGSEPLAIARALLALPACAAQPPVLYVADLDALGAGAPQVEAIAALLAGLAGVTLWLDAGFRDASAARGWQQRLGADAARLRPVFASESLADAGALDEIAADPRSILSLDSRAQQPLDPAGCWSRPERWPATLIVMTLDRVGSGEGPDLAGFERLRHAAPGRVWVGAGGVRNAHDLRAAARAGASAWLVASALHAGALGP